ncbi:acyl-CoA thioesterase [Enterovirga rhinocerotis]|uniref:Acyl-CoA hydrolase n=1 Tax=Enterovirga rhinocerotis TaxID=1339210 RepID=A0A4R7BWH3_9HYPH|nr:hotdog domain-containing protein [Enterovirga rhinocerotis]TDR90248.1 acyl-CoA hydrolase [Enterovirga rhinocerotis]
MASPSPVALPDSDREPAGRCDARLVEIVFPGGANHHGTLFGGAALALMAKTAFVAASRRAGPSIVLAASERVEFVRPVRVGEIVEYHARVTRIGRSSMSVEVEGTTDVDATGDVQVAMRGSFEMVAVDEAGRPRPITP